jgi:hypothetical protein
MRWGSAWTGVTAAYCVRLRALPSLAPRPTQTSKIPAGVTIHTAISQAFLHLPQHRRSMLLPAPCLQHRVFFFSASTGAAITSTSTQATTPLHSGASDARAQRITTLPSIYATSLCGSSTTHRTRMRICCDWTPARTSRRRPCYRASGQKGGWIERTCLALA